MAYISSSAFGLRSVSGMYTLHINKRYLAHHGVEGQKWGVRRWQNKDGSLTAEGRIHYGIEGKTSSDYKGISKKKRRQEHYDRIAQLEADKNEQLDALYQKYYNKFKNENKEDFDNYTKEFQEWGYSKEEAEKAADEALSDEWFSGFDDSSFEYLNEAEKVQNDAKATKNEINKYCKDVMGVKPFDTKGRRDADISSNARALAVIGSVGAIVVGYGLMKYGAADAIADRIKNR